MKNNDWKDRLGVMYSTNPDYQYNTEENEEEETLPKDKQQLRISLDKRNRGGKAVTLVTGFRGTNDDLTILGKMWRRRFRQRRRNHNSGRYACQSVGNITERGLYKK